MMIFMGARVGKNFTSGCRQEYARHAEREPERIYIGREPKLSCWQKYDDGLVKAKYSPSRVYNAKIETHPF